MAGTKVLNDGVSGVLRSASDEPRDRDPSDDFRDGGNDPLPAATSEPEREQHVELSDEERAEAEFFLAAAGADETEEVESP